MIQLQYMAPWVPVFSTAQEAELAAKDYMPPFTAFLFATVDENGFPRNRTLVYRGYLFENKTNNVLTFTTDKRAEKYRELMQNDKFEAVFYFEGTRKQFRFRGKARIIDDKHTPKFDLTTIQPGHVMQENIRSSANSSEDDSDSSPDDDSLEMFVNSKTSLGAASTGNKTYGSPQDAPLNFPIISPKLLEQIQQESSSFSISFTNLHELTVTEFCPPTRAEWDTEVTRIWKMLSKLLKLAFRGPDPMLLMDDEKHNLIDKISRGVDGKKEDSGMKNFAVVAMFINYVDYYDLEKSRRCIYQKDENHLWSEHEVCP